MKFRTYFLLLFLMSGQSVWADISGANLVAGNEKQLSISLEDAIKTAFQKSPLIKKEIHETDVKKSEYQDSLSGFMPEISAYFEYSGGDSPSSYLFKKIDQRMLPPGTDFNDPGRFDNFEAGLRASMRLYNGGQTQRLREMAQKSLEAQKLITLEVKNRVAFQVISVWYNLLEALDIVKIAGESVATVQEQVRIMEVKFRGGGALKSDLLSLRARLAEARERLLVAVNHTRITGAELTVIMGIDPLISIKPENGDFKIKSLPETYESLLGYALEKRPFYLAAKEIERASEIGVEKEKGGYLPTLDLQADYYHDDEDMSFSRSRENWRAGILMGWKIFDGFSTESKIKKSDAKRRKSLEDKNRILLEIKKDVRTAWFKIEIAKERLRVSKEQKREAEASFELVKRQFQGGSVDITRYLESELSRNRARMAEAAAYYENRKAKASMAYAVGILSRVVSDKSCSPKKIH